MKTILSIGLSLGLLASTAFGATISTTKYSAANTASYVNTNSLQLLSLTIQNTNLTTDATITFFDMPFTNITYTLAAYTNTYPTTASITNYYTNYFGVLNTNIFLSQVWSNVAVSASTNLYPLMFSIIVKSNTTPTIDASYRCLFGLGFTNSASVSVTANYQQ